MVVEDGFASAAAPQPSSVVTLQNPFESLEVASPTSESAGTKGDYVRFVGEVLAEYLDTEDCKEVGMKHWLLAGTVVYRLAC